ncbi:hypothetical protein CVS40_1762 [Lucilia cuprina]|nr:hypothetical protein CVS40_1762 [Lucilia cuprina]
MKFFNIFFLFGLLAVLATMGTIVKAEPLPSPRGRPATTKRPKTEGDNNDAEALSRQKVSCTSPQKLNNRKIMVHCYGENKLQTVEILLI